MKKIPVFKKTLYAMITIFIMSAFLEISLHVTGFKFRYSEVAGLPDWVRFNMNRWFLEYDPLLLWRLRTPNPDFNISKQGLRDEIIPETKSSWEYRILCLGDSCTWGHGLDYKDAYPTTLEKNLNNRTFKKMFFRVVNAGVPGYSSDQGKKYFQEKLNWVHPDLVTVYFGRNDHRILPAQWQNKHDKDQLQIRRGNSIAELKLLLGATRTYQLISLGIYKIKEKSGYLPPPPAQAPLGRDEKRLPEENRRVTTYDFIQNLREIARIAHQRNAEILLVTSPVYPDTTGNYNDTIREMAQLHEYPILDAEKAFKKQGICQLLLDDCHPNVRGSEILAELLADKIVQLYMGKNSFLINQ